MQNDVNQEVLVSEEPITTEEVTEVVPEVKPGEKTDSALLLESLKEERERRRIAEAELQALKTTPQEPEVFSDEGKALQQKITSLEEKLELKEVISDYPALKDKTSEFDEFRNTYPGVPLARLARLFLAEKDLLETPKARKGLEKSTGGGQIQPKQGLSLEEIDNIRTTNYRKYSQMVKDGQIKF